MEKKNKGFTLAELLVVVAIIGALVAIALPMFLKQKAEANLKTDQTFVKSAKATAISEYLGGDEDDDNGTGVDYIYDAGLSIAWKIDNTLNLSTIKGYGRSTQDPYKTQTGVTDESTPVSADGNPNYLQVHVTTNGKVTGACWVKPGEKTTCGEGGTVTPDPTPTPGTPDSGNKDVINIGGYDIPVDTWPNAVRFQPDNQWNTAMSYDKDVIAGNVYSYSDENGVLGYYVAINTYKAHSGNNDYWRSPKEGNWFAFPINTENPNIIDHEVENYKEGDIFVYSSTEIYLRRAASGPGQEPHKDEKCDEHWIRINIPQK